MAKVKKNWIPMYLVVYEGYPYSPMGMVYLDNSKPKLSTKTETFFSKPKDKNDCLIDALVFMRGKKNAKLYEIGRERDYELYTTEKF
jgi:hypothetical protein